MVIFTNIYSMRAPLITSLLIVKLNMTLVTYSMERLCKRSTLVCAAFYVTNLYRLHDLLFNWSRLVA
jgi:hypothetical protein